MIITNYIIALGLVCIVSYLIGSLNSAILTVYLVKHKDIRNYGSTNAGLTNVYRCFGAPCAAITLVADLLKGFVVVFGTRLVLFETGLFSAQEHDIMTACLIASLFAVLGHVFPIYYKFKGGKGILVAGTCMAAIDWRVFLCELLVFVVVVLITRYVSVGSIACCIGYPVFSIIMGIFVHGSEYTYLHAIVAGIIGVVCLLRHIPNIKRLINHTENKFSFKKKK